MQQHDWSRANRARLNRPTARIVWLALVMVYSATYSIHAQSLTWLGTFGNPYSSARDVSDDGSVVVGSSRFDNYNRAFRWTRTGGMQNLGTLPQHTYSEGYGVSADGNRVTGTAYYVIPYGGSERAFLWVFGSGMRDIGNLPGSPVNTALDISRDGATIVGWGRDYGYAIRAFRWTSGTGMVSLGTLGGNESRANGVSRDGSVVVGWSYNHLGERWAFYWMRAAGMQVLYPLAVCCGEANAVSDNGQIIVGRSHSAQTERWHACMWAWDGYGYSVSDLGTLGGNESVAQGCTNNREVVGWAHTTSGARRAFRWTPNGGMENLSETFARLLSPGSYLEIAFAITPDGRYIVGQGYNAAAGRTEAFLLDTRCVTHNGDIDDNGCVDDADLLAVLFAFGGAGQDLGRVDTNCDGVVDDADLLMVLFNFGQGC
ncbi:MAG: hypothetical protein KatS3mg019_0861 [Fimbriimonadales bacterium]|nr:MAG: hypothetical protein KatS3mg019_0861 [Fimbriimonadales bacterium]